MVSRLFSALVVLVYAMGSAKRKALFILVYRRQLAGATDPLRLCNQKRVQT